MSADPSRPKHAAGAARTPRGAPESSTPSAPMRARIALLVALQRLEDVVRVLERPRQPAVLADPVVGGRDRRGGRGARLGPPHVRNGDDHTAAGPPHVRNGDDRRSGSSRREERRLPDRGWPSSREARRRPHRSYSGRNLDRSCADPEGRGLFGPESGPILRGPRGSRALRSGIRTDPARTPRVEGSSVRNPDRSCADPEGRGLLGPESEPIVRGREGRRLFGPESGPIVRGREGRGLFGPRVGVVRIS
jgi:hypothetical protein